MPTRSSKEMLAEANGAVETIPVEQAIAMAGDPAVVFVDVREGSEREKGTVKGSVHASRSFLSFMPIRPAPCTSRNSPVARSWSCSAVPEAGRPSPPRR